MNLDPVSGQSIGQKLRRIPLFVAEKHRILLDEGHPRSQPREGLRELASDRTPADDQQSLRALGQVEHVLVGQIPSFFEARDRRTHGPRTRRDQRLLEAQHVASHRHRIGAGKARLTEVYIDAHRGKSLRRAALAQARANAPHALHHRREVHGNSAGHPPAEVLCVPHLPVQARGSNDCLGGDAAIVQATTPQKIALDERDLGTPADGGPRRDETRRSRPDNQQVVGASGVGVAP
jgi:hypothetical protein